MECVRRLIIFVAWTEEKNHHCGRYFYLLCKKHGSGLIREWTRVGSGISNGAFIHHPFEIDCHFKSEINTCIAPMGGMERLERHYIEEGERTGVCLKIFNSSEINIDPKIRNVDEMVIFTNKVSHRAKVEAVKVAKANSIPVYLHHSFGV